jgi:hypothetical protein
MRWPLLLALLAACGDDAVDLGAFDATPAVDAAPVDAPGPDAPPLRHVTWSIERVGGKPGCGGDVVAVGLSHGGWPEADKIFPCEDGEAWVDVPGTLVAIAHAWNLTYLGGAHTLVTAEEAPEVHLTITLTDEPRGPLETLQARVDNHFAQSGDLPADVATPTGDCCSNDDHLCPLDVQDWADFASLGFALETPRRYDYEVTSTARTVRIRALGDFDCDLVMNDLFVVGEVTPEGIVWSEPASERTNE